MPATTMQTQHSGIFAIGDTTAMAGGVKQVPTNATSESGTAAGAASMRLQQQMKESGAACGHTVIRGSAPDGTPDRRLCMALKL